MVSALHLLFALGAVDAEGQLTRPLGQAMAELPMAPMHAKALIASPDFECSAEIGFGFWVNIV
jgi:ATP-dependent RNA helicase DDX35